MPRCDGAIEIRHYYSIQRIYGDFDGLVPLEVWWAAAQEDGDAAGYF